jgi:tetratricopeptide (TPR) repeat protein
MKFKFFKKFRKKSPEKNFEAELKKLKKAAEVRPDDVRINIKIAEHYLEANRKKEAIETFLFAAQEYQKKRLIQIAIAIYKNIISIDPDQCDVYLKLAELQIKNELIGDGVALLEKLAKHYYEKGMKFEASQVLDRIANVDPDNEFFIKKVDNFYKEKDLTADDARSQGPQDKWKLVEVAQKEDENPSDLPQSFFDLEEALGEDESYSFDANIEESEADSQTEPGDKMSPDEVLNKLQEMVKASPDQDNPAFHYNMALALYRSNKFEQAIGEFEQAVDGDKQNIDIYKKLAGCAKALNDFKKAGKYIKKGLSVKNITTSDELDLNFEMGLIYKSKGDKKRALKVFKKIQKKNEMFRSVNNEIVKLS